MALGIRSLSVLFGSLVLLACVVTDPFKVIKPAPTGDDADAPEAGPTITTTATPEAGPPPDSSVDPRPVAPDSSVDSTPVPPDASADSGCKINPDCPTPENECQVAHCNQGRCAPKFADEETPCGGGLRCNRVGECVACLVNGKKDFEETDRDCGGPYCPGCEADGACGQHDDCASLICRQPDAGDGPGTCAAASCVDGKKNGTEGGVDCGGDCPERCTLGAGCKVASDCSSNFCVDGVCCGTACDETCRSCLAGSGVCRIAPEGTDPRQQCGQSSCDGNGECAACTDSEKNGNESDVDCGGDCKGCDVGQECARSADCASCLCENRKCQAPRCNNETIDGCETDTDCGGLCGPFCSVGQRCSVKADCQSGSCVCKSDSCKEMVCAAP